MVRGNSPSSSRRAFEYTEVEDEVIEFILDRDVCLGVFVVAMVVAVAAAAAEEVEVTLFYPFIFT